MHGSSFLEDPFFSQHAEQMGQMFQPPVFSNRRSIRGIEDGHGGGRRAIQRRQQQEQHLSHRNSMMDPFAHFNSMFSNMRNMMVDMHHSLNQPGIEGPNTHAYQHTSFYSSSNTNGDGRPKVFQASSTVRQAPGGVRETKKTVRDSETGIDRAAVGHHIKEKGHVIERSRNNRTGESNQNQEFINIDEEEAPAFDREFQERWRGVHGLHGVEQRRRRLREQTQRHGHHRSELRALPEPESTSRRPRKTSHRKN